uniref:FK506-binding protein n=1 Tax=Lygus hesperus TaxID=30085 RepID=A0A146LIJ7_LYGHE
MTSMFWGLRLEPGKRYSTTVGRSFHVSMAALDCASVKNENEVNSVMLEETESSVPFILCNLQKQKTLQCSLDLNFMTGDRITFFCKGNGTIHLSGYVHEDPDEDDYGNLLGEEEEDEEAEDEEEDEEEVEEGDALPKGKKQLKANGLTGKRPNESPQKAGKKPKLDKSAEDDSDDDEDIDDLMGLKVDSDDEDEDDDDEDEDEEESEEDEEESSTPQKQQKQVQKNKNAQSNKAEKQPQNGVQLSKKEKKKEAAKQKNEAAATQKQQKDQPEVAQKKTIQGGVQIKDIRIGSGNVCKPGQKATVYYVGRLKDNNKVFDSAKKGNGFTFAVGKGEVIKGWDVGVVGMKVGGKRTIICPPNMAYGQRGSPPTIPPNSSLVFEVELRHTK